mgnify:CR=1 FL=1
MLIKYIMDLDQLLKRKNKTYIEINTKKKELIQLNDILTVINKNIQNLCPHTNIERLVEYGDPTTYECMDCHLSYDFRDKHLFNNKNKVI